MSRSAPARLLARDAEDLQVIAAMLQDAVFRVGDLRYDRTARIFTLEGNRFRWESGRRLRTRSVVSVQDVVRVRRKGLAVERPNAVANLLTVEFAPDAEPPSGTLTFLFSGDGALAMEVECLEVWLVDAPQHWRTSRRPKHPEVKSGG